MYKNKPRNKQKQITSEGVLEDIIFFGFREKRGRVTVARIAQENFALSKRIFVEIFSFEIFIHLYIDLSTSCATEPRRLVGVNQ